MSGRKKVKTKVRIKVRLKKRPVLLNGTSERESDSDKRQDEEPNQLPRPRAISTPEHQSRLNEGAAMNTHTITSSQIAAKPTRLNTEYENQFTRLDEQWEEVAEAKRKEHGTKEGEAQPEKPAEPAGSQAQEDPDTVDDYYGKTNTEEEGKLAEGGEHYDESEKGEEAKEDAVGKEDEECCNEGERMQYGEDYESGEGEEGEGENGDEEGECEEGYKEGERMQYGEDYEGGEGEEGEGENGDVEGESEERDGECYENEEEEEEEEEEDEEEGN